MFKSGMNSEFRTQITAGASSTLEYLLAAGVGLVVALFVLMAFSASRGGADTRPDLYSLPRDASYPEGIAADNKSGNFYVSSAADGSIYGGNVKRSDLELLRSGVEDGRPQALGMTLDDAGRLYVAGGFTGKVFVFDTSSEKPALIRTFGTQEEGNFLNDVTIDPRSGDAYITDSFKPVIWRVPAEKVKTESEGQLDRWLDIPPDAIEYPAGFNLNGIVATPDGSFLLTVQSNTGNLYRIDTQTQQIAQVKGLGDKELLNGDGLVLKGDTLYVVRNADDLITEVLLDDLFTSEPFGQVKEETTVPSPSLPGEGDFPTTAALVGGRLLVVNSQFDEGFLPGSTDEPERPFTVSSMRAQ